MIIMPVPKDIRAIKSKFIGPLTKRQFMALVPAALLDIAAFMLLKGTVSQEALMGAVVVIDIPFVMCGFVDVYGLPLWTYLKDVAIPNTLAPKRRPYVTENTYESLAKQHRITYEYFDGAVSGPETKNRKKEAKRRLQLFLKENPGCKPIE